MRSQILMTTVIVLASMVANVQTATAQDLTASTLAPLPIAVSNNAVTSVNHADGSYSLYSFMGTSLPSGSVATPTAYRYDSIDEQWTQLTNAPRLNGRAKVGASAISVAGDVYLIGGYTTGFNERTEERLFRYNDATDDYTQLSSVPTGVDDTVVGVYLDRFIYLVSGWHGSINDNVLNVQVYDTVTDIWQQADPLPGPSDGVFGHSGTLIGNRLITFDGTISENGFHIDDNVYVGEIQTGSGAVPTDVVWTELDAHPGSPTYRAAASQGDFGDGNVLVLGGTDNPYNISGIGYNGVPSLPLDQALLFDPITEEWQSLSIGGDYMPTMDHRGLVRAGDGWVTIGGMVDSGVLTDRVVLFTVPEPTGILILLLAVIATCSVRR